MLQKLNSTTYKHTAGRMVAAGFLRSPVLKYALCLMPQDLPRGWHVGIDAGVCFGQAGNRTFPGSVAAGQVLQLLHSFATRAGAGKPTKCYALGMSEDR